MTPADILPAPSSRATAFETTLRCHDPQAEAAAQADAEYDSTAELRLTIGGAAQLRTGR